MCKNQENVPNQSCYHIFNHIGTNHVIVIMQASNVLTECIGDQEHLTFKVDVKVTNTADDKSYGPVTANEQKCDAKIKFSI